MLCVPIRDRCSTDEAVNSSVAFTACMQTAADAHSSVPVCPDGPPTMSMSQRMCPIYLVAPGATGWKTCARSLAERATSSTTEEVNDRCRTSYDSTAEKQVNGPHSPHSRCYFRPTLARQCVRHRGSIGETRMGAMSRRVIARQNGAAGSLEGLMTRYPDEESCERRLIEIERPGGWCCPRCGNDRCSR